LPTFRLQSDESHNQLDEAFLFEMALQHGGGYAKADSMAAAFEEVAQR